MVTGTPEVAGAAVIPRMILNSCWQQRVDRDGQLGIQLAEAAEIVGGQFNGYPVVNVAPVRMVVAAFGQQGYLAHETEGLHEVAELKITAQLFTINDPVGVS